MIMDLNKWNEDIEGSNIYKFMIHHKKILNIIQGLVIIGLLIGINMYVYQDYEIKKQIKDHCGYTTSTYECVCDKSFVAEWKALQRGEFEINLTSPGLELPKAQSIVEFLPQETQDYINERNSLNIIRNMEKDV